MGEQAAACAHLAVSYRTEPVDDDEYTRGFYIRGWWECDSDCGAVFVSEARLSTALGVISMLEHHWISPMEYYEATEAREVRLSKMETAFFAANAYIAYVESGATRLLPNRKREAWVLACEALAGEDNNEK
jgi:hypothetical protein